MSTALAERKLTDLQQRFVDMILEGNPVLRDAELTGIGSPRVHAYRFAALPYVQRAIAEGLTKRFMTEGAPLAYSVLVKFVGDEAVSPRVRVDAAKALLDRAGFVPPKAGEQLDTAEKDLSAMSPDELRAFIASAEGRLAQESERRDAGGVGLSAHLTSATLSGWRAPSASYAGLSNRNSRVARIGLKCEMRTTQEGEHWSTSLNASHSICNVSRGPTPVQ
jgi:hypothetical protein